MIETSAPAFDHGWDRDDHGWDHGGRHRRWRRGKKKDDSSADAFLKLAYGRIVEYSDVEGLKYTASGLLAPYMRLCADDPGCDGTLAHALEARIDELLLRHWRMVEVGLVLDRLRVLGRKWDEAHRVRELRSGTRRNS